jgi:hypothetical protein
MNDEFINLDGPDEFNDVPPHPNKLKELSDKLQKVYNSTPMTEEEIIAWCEAEWSKLIDEI